MRLQASKSYWNHRMTITYIHQIISKNINHVPHCRLTLRNLNKSLIHNIFISPRTKSIIYSVSHSTILDITTSKVAAHFTMKCYSIGDKKQMKYLGICSKWQPGSTDPIARNQPQFRAMFKKDITWKVFWVEKKNYNTRYNQIGCRKVNSICA